MIKTRLMTFVEKRLLSSADSLTADMLSAEDGVVCSRLQAKSREHFERISRRKKNKLHGEIIFEEVTQLQHGVPLLCLNISFTVSWKE